MLRSRKWVISVTPRFIYSLGRTTSFLMAFSHPCCLLFLRTNINWHHFNTEGRPWKTVQKAAALFGKLNISLVRPLAKVILNYGLASSAAHILAPWLKLIKQNEDFAFVSKRCYQSLDRKSDSWCQRATAQCQRTVMHIQAFLFHFLQPKHVLVNMKLSLCLFCSPRLHSSHFSVTSMISSDSWQSALSAGDAVGRCDVRELETAVQRDPFTVLSGHLIRHLLIQVNSKLVGTLWTGHAEENTNKRLNVHSKVRMEPVRKSSSLCTDVIRVSIRHRSLWNFNSFLMTPR